MQNVLQNTQNVSQHGHVCDIVPTNRTTTLDITSYHTLGLPLEVWPTRRGRWVIDQGYARQVPFCYVDQRTYEKIGDSGANCKILKAINIWADALGGAPDAISGHSFGLRVPNPPDEFCCTNYRYGAENQPLSGTDLQCDWNHEKWPSDTLAIHWVDDVKTGGNAAASVGYYRAADLYQHPGRHYMRVPSGAPSWTIAHEFGHGKFPNSYLPDKLLMC